MTIMLLSSLVSPCLQTTYVGLNYHEIGVIGVVSYHRFVVTGRDLARNRDRRIGLNTKQ